MSAVGLEQELAQLLAEMNASGGFAVSLVCTDEGLLVASSGEHLPSEQLAGLTSLFDDIVLRAQRDLSVHRVDEVTLLDPGRGRLVVRPIALDGERRFFLVLQAPPRASWRRLTNQVARELVERLAPLVGAL